MSPTPSSYAASPAGRSSFPKCQMFRRDPIRFDPMSSFCSFAILRIVTILSAITLLVAPKTRADGGSATWLFNPDTPNWVTSPGVSNWSTGNKQFPGQIGTLTNPDTAIFLTSNTLSITINSASLNVKSLNFGSSVVTPSNFTIGSTAGNSLLLSSGGEIAILGLPSGVTGVTETVNAPLVLEPATSSTAGTYTFRNSSTSTTNSLTIGGSVSGGSTSSTITLSLGGSNTGANTVSGAISNGSASGGLSITKDSGGTWKLAGNNTYSGTTIINGGTLTVAGTGSNQALGGTSGITVNSGGTLFQTSSNQIKDTAGMTLNGGTYMLNGVSEGTTAAGGAGLGALTLTSSSIIDLTGTNPSLHFAASNGQPWSGTLSIWNWNGTVTTGNGVEQIAFGSNNGGLTAAQLGEISFFSGNGTGFLGTARFAPDVDGEIIPVPESSTWVAGALALLVAGYTHRRSFRRKSGFMPVA